MKYVPMYGNVLVRSAAETKSAGGLYMPPSVVQEGQLTGVIEATGEGHLNQNNDIRPLKVKVGDRVLFTTKRAQQINESAGFKGLYLMNEIDIMVILVDDNG
jgi:chaperonin GroES